MQRSICGFNVTHGNLVNSCNVSYDNGLTAVFKKIYERFI